MKPYGTGRQFRNNYWMFIKNLPLDALTTRYDKNQTGLGIQQKHSFHLLPCSSARLMKNRPITWWSGFTSWWPCWHRWPCGTTLAGCIVRWTGVVDGQRIDLDTCKLKEPESLNHLKHHSKNYELWHYNHVLGNCLFRWYYSYGFNITIHNL